MSNESENNFNNLTTTQQLAQLCAIHVRSALENIHAEDDGRLPDSSMKEVNTLVRDAIYEVLIMQTEVQEDPEKEVDRLRFLEYLQLSIPHYWEAPKMPTEKD
jgi:hypothetical protein